MHTYTYTFPRLFNLHRHPLSLYCFFPLFCVRAGELSGRSARYMQMRVALARNKAGCVAAAVLLFSGKPRTRIVFSAAAKNGKTIIAMCVYSSSWQKKRRNHNCMCSQSAGEKENLFQLSSMHIWAERKISPPCFIIAPHTLLQR
jgi:hypothetical protein